MGYHSSVRLAGGVLCVTILVSFMILGNFESQYLKTVCHTREAKFCILFVFLSR